MKKIVLLIFLLLTRSYAESLNALKPIRTSSPPVIDGKLDDPIWQQALAVTGFKTFSPDYGKDGYSKTTAYAAYDNENLYFAFYCVDNEPEKIKSSISGRDKIRPDDWVCINLDTFNDHQSLYAFYVNPAGIQADSRYAAGIEDFSADYIWYSAGKLQSDGYSVEMRIPLNSIRYSDGDTVMMSLFFERYTSRFSEHVSYPELDPAKGTAFLTQMIPLLYNDLQINTLWEVLPAFTFSRKYIQEAGQLKRNENRGELSITSKFGITSDLILDGTYNPDFSQIEADAGQVDVNLRYALFFPEKRSFFQEGNEIYNVAATQSTAIDPVVSFVHTRTIINPITGMKLSGKLDSRSSIALMYTVDELASDQKAVYGNYAYSPVLRFKRAFNDDSYIGMLFTDREMKDSYNRVIGLDGMLRLSESGTVQFNGFLSDTKSSPAGNQGKGNTFGLNFTSDTRNLALNFSSKSISENFNSETGYLSRSGILYFTGMARPKFYPGSSVFQRIDTELFLSTARDLPSGLWESDNYISAQVYLLGSLLAGTKYSNSTEIFEKIKFKTGGVSFSIGGLLSKRLSFSVVYKINDAIYYSQSPYQGKNNQLVSYLIYQPAETVESYSSFIFSDFRNKSNSQLVYEYLIFRERITYQPNKYLFFRGVVEYNKYKRQLITDFLVSFTYVPGTVIHVGYGSLYGKTEWSGNEYRYIESRDFHESQRGFFFKMSYLWRL